MATCRSSCNVTRQVDDAHASASEFAFDRVLPRERILQVEELRGRIAHERDTSGTRRDVPGAKPNSVPGP